MNHKLERYTDSNGTIYYAIEGKGLTAWKTTDARQGLGFREGSTVDVQFPNGTLETVTLSTLPHSTTVDGLEVKSNLFGFRAFYKAIPLFIEITDVRVRESSIADL